MQWAVWLGVSLGIMPALATAATVTIAAAANFRETLDAIAAEFEVQTPHEVTVVTASTGQLYAQITGGAPYDVLLAADEIRPRRLADAGIGDPASLYTYAIGQLVLWTRDSALLDGLGLEVLRGTRFRWLAIANPALAPYGAAAEQTLEALGVWETLQARIVRGENIAQTFLMVDSGNAELGLVALSQVIGIEGTAAYMIVPPALYEPIRQDAILLKRAEHNPAAVSFMEFLKSPAAVSLIEAHGYVSGSR